MNKVINVFSGLILAIFCAFVMAVVYDLTISTNFTLKGMPYKQEIAYGFTLIILLLGVLRIVRKWQGAKDMTNFNKFTFVRPIATSAKNLSLIYALIEVVFMGILIYFLYRISALDLSLVFPMLIVISFLLLEGIIFAYRIGKGGKAFRIGINKNVVAYFNREMHLMYFTGLKRVEMHQDMINFQYKDDLNILMPLDVLEKSDLIPFRDALIETLATELRDKKGKNIYIDDAFRTLE